MLTMIRVAGALLCLPPLLLSLVAAQKMVDSGSGTLAPAEPVAEGALSQSQASAPQSQATASQVQAVSPQSQAVATRLEAVVPQGDQQLLGSGFVRLLEAVVRIDVWETRFSDGVRTTGRGFGSGVIIDEQGHILTNAHVVSPYVERIMVTLNNLERVPAKLVGWDHWTDLAVIALEMGEIRSRGLQFGHARFGDSATLYPGQTVYAVGTPNGLSRTVTRGIISNTTRYFEGRTVGNGYETGYFNTWLQTDAAINPGNSGGPLALPDGEVVGINTRAYLGANNLAFAVPGNIAKEVLKALIDKGRIERTDIGILLGAMQDLENFFHLKVNQGVLIQSVNPGSPAEKAGLRPGDILMAINGRAVDGRFPEQLPAIQRQIASAAAADTLHLEISRNGKPLQVDVVAEPLQSRVGQMQAFAQWGMSVQKISLAVAREEQLRSADGVRVMGAQGGFPAAEAGLQRGDVIVAANGERLHDLAQLERIYENYRQTPQRILLEVTRNRQEIYLVLRPR